MHWFLEKDFIVILFISVALISFTEQLPYIRYDSLYEGNLKSLFCLLSPSHNLKPLQGLLLLHLKKTLVPASETRIMCGQQ